MCRQTEADKVHCGPMKQHYKIQRIGTLRSLYKCSQPAPCAVPELWNLPHTDTWEMCLISLFCICYYIEVIIVPQNRTFTVRVRTLKDIVTKIEVVANPTRQWF